MRTWFDTLVRPTFAAAARWRTFNAGVWMILIAWMTALPACATRAVPLMQEPITAATLARNGIGCTPLLLLVHAKGQVDAGRVPEGADGPPGVVGCGSGVFIHPRVILTANHVVPADPTFVVAFDGIGGGSHGEAVVIERVVRPAGTPHDRSSSSDGYWGDDWAMIVLERPCTRFQPVATVPEREAGLGVGAPIVFVGFPFAEQGDHDPDPLARRGVLVHTFVAEATAAVHAEPGVYHARSSIRDFRREGASGSPVFAGPELVGIYVGHIDTNTLLNTPVSRTLVIQRLPLERIRSVLREVGANAGTPAG